MSKHTPGPWLAIEAGPREVRLKRDHWEIGSETTRRGVAYVFGGDDANAKLIAAAPELLELANRLASECAECDGRGFVYGDDGVSGRGPDDVEPTRVACAECDDIRAVIAKATSHS